jgi:hypothetical protein
MLDRHPALLGSTLLSALVLAGCGAGGYGAPARQASSADSTAYPGTTVAGGGAAPEHVAVGGDAVVSPAPDERPGLGTVWGESVWAPVTTEPFVRASTQPWSVVAIHYNDAEGVAAHAQYLGASLTPIEVLAGDGSIGVSIVDATGALLPGVAAAGRTLVVGADGERYRLVVRNGTTARFEVVASVDGLDVIDGQPADPARRGYILDPHGVLVIDGFRQSNDQVAAFTFGAVDASYAARTSGDRNVGVIGFAIFAEEGAVWTPAELHRRDTADPFPARSYAQPPP